MDSIAAEKRTAMLRYGRLQRITTLLRCLEAVAVAAATLWSSAHIPAVARSSVDLLLRLIPVLLGPRFLFLLGNAIVITLLFRSRHGSSDEIPSISAFIPPPPPPLPDPAGEVVFEDKKVLREERRAAPPRRSRSEKLDEPRQRSPELRRAETDVKARREEDEEEFRRTIEAFIQKQWKFQREESMAVVCCRGTEGLNCSAGTVEAREII